MRKELRVSPVNNAVSLADVKLLAEIHSNERDSELQMFIDAAIPFIEDKIGRAIITQEWDIYYNYNEFYRDASVNKAVYLSTLNVNSIEQLSYFAVDGTETIVSPADYRLSADRIVFDSYLNVLNARDIDAFKVEVTAGYGASGNDIDNRLRTAIALMAQHWLLNGAMVSDTDLKHVPDTVRALLLGFTSTNNWIK